MPSHDHNSNQNIPQGHILEWSMKEVADYISSLGLDRYHDMFLDHEVVGEALAYLGHDDLRDMGVDSVGHRITILKSVYYIKTSHDVPINDGDYVPVSVDAEASASANQTATQSDIQRLVHHIKQRDERIAHAENELRKMTEMVAKLREEILPLYRLVKEKAPLPTPSSGRAPMQDIPPLPTPVGYSSEPTTSRERDRDRDRREEREQRDRDRDQVIDPPIQAPPTGGILARKFSTKRLFLGAPKNKSPTHQTYQEKSEYDNPPLATLQNGNSYQSTQSTLSSNSYNILPPGINILPPNMNTNLPSPKSPSNMQHNLNHQHSSATLNPNQSRQPPYRNNSNTMSYATQNEIQPEPSANQNASSSSSSQPTAEIFKSFRVSMDDPCYKVLPAALKRYNIQADWRQYALYIVYGDQERCLELDERPLILFKQLDREGRKPMFMLRRNATATDGISLPPGGII